MLKGKNFNLNFLLFLSLLVANLFSISFASDRFVSLAPNLTEWIYYFGQENKLAGVSLQCDFPESVRSLPKVGSFSSPKVEVIAKLNPTLVFVTQGNSLDAVNLLKRLNIKVHTFHAPRLKDLPEQLNQLSSALGQKQKYQDWVHKFHNQLQKNKELARSLKTKPSVLLVLDVDPVFSVSSQTWLWDLFESVGYENAVQRPLPEYPVLSSENLLTIKPQLIFNLTQSFSGAGRPKAHSQKPVWTTLDKFIIPLNKGVEVKKIDLDAQIFSRPGPRLLEALSKLYDIRSAERVK